MVVTAAFISYAHARCDVGDVVLSIVRLLVSAWAQGIVLAMAFEVSIQGTMFVLECVSVYMLVEQQCDWLCWRNAKIICGSARVR